MVNTVIEPHVMKVANPAVLQNGACYLMVDEKMHSLTQLVLVLSLATNLWLTGMCWLQTKVWWQVVDVARLLLVTTVVEGKDTNSLLY